VIARCAKAVRLEIVRDLIAEAAATSLNREARWVRLSDGLAEDEERRAIRHLARFIRLAEEGNGNPDDMEPLDRVQA
jgi:putative heme iron utilization protein